MADKFPLREKRKQETHEALIHAAETLFLERGFGHVTMEEVAAQAGMHVQTVYRHFPSKMDLAVAIDGYSLDQFRAAFSTRESDTLTFWRQWVINRAEEYTKEHGKHLRSWLREQIERRNTAASSLFQEVDREYEALLADGIKEDLAITDDSDKTAVLIACMLWGGNRHAWRSWAASDSSENLANEVSRMIDAIVGTLNPETVNAISGRARH